MGTTSASGSSTAPPHPGKVGAGFRQAPASARVSSPPPRPQGALREREREPAPPPTVPTAPRPSSCFLLRFSTAGPPPPSALEPSGAGGAKACFFSNGVVLRRGPATLGRRRQRNLTQQNGPNQAVAWGQLLLSPLSVGVGKRAKAIARRRTKREQTAWMSNRPSF